jgi:peptide-methionine (S)-S-oxide reductase
MSTSSAEARRLRPAAIAVGLLLLAAVGAGFGIVPSAAEDARAIPPPKLDRLEASAEPQVAVFAGGCFWGVQGVFQHVDGVLGAVSGYAGGDAATAEYGRVGTGRTGHAEAVQVTFDPGKVSYGRLMQVFFSVAHDPTQLDRQGPDVGPQYRSAIFPADAAQAQAAAAYIVQLDQAHAFDDAIVTRIEPDKAFYPAEAYHQDFLTRNPHHPYIVINDLPKIVALKRLFPELYRAEPVLVAASAAGARL